MQATAYYPSGLRRLLDGIAEKFPLPSEYASRQAAEGWQELIEAAPTEADALRIYSLRLPAAGIDNLLLAALEEMDEKRRERLESILAVRSGSRLMKLCWALIQYHSENVGLLSATRALLKGFEGGRGIIRTNLELFADSDGTDRLTRALLRKSGMIADFLTANCLDESSPLARRVVRLFFCECSSEGLVLNSKRFTRMLDFEGGELLEKMISNYLQRLTMSEYSAETNLLIGEKWGNAFTSPDWANIAPSLRHRFSEWNSRYRLAEHFTHNKKKLELYCRYIPNMRDIQFLYGGMMLVMDFGDFAVADQNESGSNSYYIEGELFTKLRAELDENGESALLIKYPDMAQARDFMILEQEPQVMRLSFAEVGKLHVRDTLNILLKLTPDLRPSKTLIKNRPRDNAGRVKFKP